MIDQRHIEIYDTTLRDGTQGAGINLSVHDKLAIARRLDDFGVHYIEGGWPGSNPKDIQFFEQASVLPWKNAKLVAFGSTCRKNIPASSDPQVQLLIQANTPVITIYGKTSLLHVTEILQCSKDENLRMIGDTIRYLKQHGRTVIYDAEHAFDGYKLSSSYALATWQAAVDAGADQIVLCDTNGGCLPEDVYSIVATAVSALKCPIGIHTHNDSGLAVANALAAVRAGANHVQGTVNGYGERTGNCDIISVIPCLHFKMGYSSIPASSINQLKAVSQYVDAIANLPHNTRLPWVGSSAFSHKGGTHVNAIDKLVSSYEHIDPIEVGNQRNILVSDLAGKSNIILKAKQLGFSINPNDPVLSKIVNEVKELESLGYEYEAASASLALLVAKHLSKEINIPFTIDMYHVSMRRNSVDSICEATLKTTVHNKVYHTVAEGHGPLNALDQALRHALNDAFPILTTVKLVDYKVRILPGNSGTTAKTRVLITSTNGRQEWGTVGVSENIIEASLQALIDSLQHAILYSSML